MSQPLIVLDSHYLCYRAFHTQGQLSYRGVMTGVIYGFLKSIQQFKDDFQTDRVAFCFEGWNLKRKQLCGGYKEGRRKTYTEEEMAARGHFLQQIRDLQCLHLPKIGFKNVFNYDGYESDDIMASIAQTQDCDIILVTADSDMFQCLRPNVTMWSPQKNRMFTQEWLWKEYGVTPSQWAVVKAIAGCKSDDVPGIPGIGEKTAIKYVRRELPENSAAYKKITCEEGKQRVRDNKPLVKLPFKGCPVPEIREDNITKKAWLEVCGHLGMKSLSNQMPVATRRLMSVKRV